MKGPPPKFFRKRSVSGVSNLVSSVIVAAIALTMSFAIMGVAIGWGLSTMQSARTSTGAGIAWQKSIVFIEHVYVQGGQTTVYLFNPGKVALRIYDITIANVGQTSNPTNGLLQLSGTADPNQLAPAEFGWLTVSVPGGLTNNLVVKVYAAATTVYDPKNLGWNLEHGVVYEYPTST